MTGEFAGPSSGRSALIEPYDPLRVAFWTGGEPLTLGRLMARASRLAAELPDRRYALNYCEARDSFTVALLAAWINHQTIVLLADRSEHSFAAFKRDYPDLYCISDAAVPFSDTDVVEVDLSMPACGDEQEPPTLPLDHLAIRIFTSGSTGRPSANDKTWAMLIAGAKAIPSMIGIESLSNPAVIATVPSQHMYGLETTIMHVLQGDISSHRERPVYPADIARCLSDSCHPRVLVTTPVHLRALLETPITIPPVDRIISATAPLSPELASAAEARFDAPLREIYGFTEAGSVASRRTTFGAEWSLRGDFRALEQGGQQYVQWIGIERQVPFPDRIEIVDSNHIRLLGRAQDVINVAGKRASLSGLTAQLLEIEGVNDGIFFLPSEDEGKGVVSRLMVFVVAPDLTDVVLRRELKRYVDPAFMPRHIVRLDALPRNATGKLPQESLKKLATQYSNREVVLEIHLNFDEGDPCLDGHFKSNPIVPATAILSRLISLVEAHESLTVRGIRSARFKAALKPGVSWLVKTRRDADETLSVKCTYQDTVVLKAVLVVDPG